MFHVVIDGEEEQSRVHYACLVDALLLNKALWPGRTQVYNKAVIFKKAF